MSLERDTAALIDCRLHGWDVHIGVAGSHHRDLLGGCGRGKSERHPRGYKETSMH
jgi:hypothetical protein